MAYEVLKTDELSEVVEDEVDRITNTCEAGAMLLEKCLAALKLSDGDYQANR